MGIKEDITKIYVGYYDRAPDPAGLDYWIGRANAGMTLPEIAASFAVQAESIAKYPYLDNPLVASASVFVTTIYNNLFNRAPDTAGLAHWVAELAAGKAVGQMIIDIMSGAKDDANGNDLTTLNNKVAVGIDFAADLSEVSGLDYENNAAAKVAASDALNGVTDAAGTITAANAATDAFVAAGAGVGQAFALTTGTDAIIGTDGVDIISATNATLTPLDSVDGADGMDTLSYVSAGGAVVAGDLSPAGSSIVNVEKLAVASAAGVALNAADMGTFSDLNVAASAAGAVSAASTSSLKSASVTTTGTANITGVSTTLESVSLTGTGASNVTSSALTSVMLKNNTGTLSNLSAVVGTREVAVSLNNSAGYIDGQATTVNVNATGAASTAATLSVGSATAVNISGDVALTVGTFADGTAATVTNTSTAAVTITPALDNDTTYVGGGAADTITLGLNTKATTTGAGDDTVTTGAALGTGGTVDAGAGTDTLAMSSADAATASLTTTFGDAVSNFETLSLGAVATGATDTVKMSNLDGLSTIVSAGTAPANVVNAAVKEVQTLTIANVADADGGILKVGGVDILISNGLSVAGIQAAIAAQQAALLVANPTLESVTTGGAGEVIFTHKATAGDVALITVAENPAGVAFVGGVSEATPGVNGTAEVQTLTVGTAAAQTGTFAVAGVDVSVLVADGTAAVAGKIAGALTAAIGANNPAVANMATAGVVGSTVVITYKQVPGNNNIAANASVTGADAIFGAGNEPAVVETTPGANGTAEVQTFVVDNTDADGGEIVIGGAKISLAGNLTADQVGATIAANAAAIKALNPTIDTIGYNTIGSVVTVTYIVNTGDVANITAVDNTDHNGASALPVIAETTPGELFVGTPGGVLNITDAVANSTVEFTGAVGGNSSIVLADATGTSDVVNLKFSAAAGFTNAGTLSAAGVETVNIALNDTAGATSVFTAPLNIAAATSVVITGNAGIDLSGSTLTAATTVDASGVTAGNVTVATAATTGVTISGGAGNDVLSGSSAAGKTDTINGNAGNDVLNGGAGNDTINGGAGTDTIMGGLGIDTLTGGADADTFMYTAAAQSNSVNVDVITDFVSGTDKLSIDTLGVGTYTGEAVGYGAVLTALAGGGVNGQAVLDTSTSTLYVDADGSGTLDNNDYAIQLTGVTDLAAADFLFV
ncbi:DUF4214 domain-containing protein [Maritalea porphyrae]|uniref:DUF4214 domain-containing protein n=1 Tax=Maritalea porphyrae TaxID=880732 RepID=UPI0022B02D2A|nr:DUF4214 domain-containing protein [Maritalea porphyrae]MCZ4271948.1 DUF4214 domain-containing protein [Maritalea porphyrae]